MLRVFCSFSHRSNDSFPLIILLSPIKYDVVFIFYFCEVFNPIHTNAGANSVEIHLVEPRTE